MSDQDTDKNQEKNEAEVALDIELVSVEEAEEEAAQSRGQVDPEQGKIEQELAEQMSEVLDQAEFEAEEEIEVEQDSSPEPAVEEEPEVIKAKPPTLKTKAEKVVEDDDVMLFDGDDDLLEENAPGVVENQVELEGDDGFIVNDDNEMDAGDKVSKEKMASASDIEGLTEIVLDAAGAANEAAHSTNQSIHMLLGSVTTINKMAKNLRKTNSYLLGFIISLGVVGLMSGAAMLYVLQSAVKDATAISIAMGSKLVQFEKQMDRVNLIEAQLIDVADVNHQLGQSVEQVMYYLKQVGTDSQQAASKQSIENQLMLGSVNEQILTSFEDLQNTTKAQQGVLTQLKKRIDGLQMQMKKIQNQDLVGKMKALIALEQGRYFELEQAKLALQTAQLEAKEKAETPPVEDTYITFGVKSE
ncbi:hypothetical protein ABXT70_03705 [Candidatus Njordibacter sp. Uisw_039]|jgi:hypothetical protein|uniref:hypothetical protein n=1 Tax=Candidatus Njordibacter sp. Uisw_039 TaxID=3230972 RepID=UPI003A254EAC|tara:strand:- start:12901 stop:14142 length:1242 start_codon:yes stop_codon:yes gene_type:complete